MRTLLVIGIGAGGPDQVTVEAVRALNRAEAFFVMDKGPGKAELLAHRRAVCERHVARAGYRFVEIADPVRDPGAPGYEQGVEDWHARRAELCEAAIARELGPQGCGAFLVWGDPSLYDSTLRLTALMRARGRLAFRQEVFPGVTSLQALAARHETVLNGIGAPVLVTTGRRLAAEGLPPLVEEGGSVVVMLDGSLAFQRFADRADLEILWSANLGTADEVSLGGPIAAVAETIAARRAEVRRRAGWVMDIYLIRRPEG